MSRLHAFVQKRQLLFIQLVLLSCALGGCTDQRVEGQQRIAPTCDQQCGKRLDERTFVCIDHCHLETDRAHLP
jgi:hypothetical protein